MTHQMSKPHTSAPMNSAAIHAPTQMLVMGSVRFVVPGSAGSQPRFGLASFAHPANTVALAALMAASVNALRPLRRGVRFDTVEDLPIMLC